MHRQTQLINQELTNPKANLTRIWKSATGL